MRNATFLLLLMTSILSTTAQEANSAFAQEFGKVWERAKTYTLEVAEAMPAEQYAYRPNEDVLTFGGHFTHIIENCYSLTARFIAEEKWPLDDRLNANEMTKAEIIEQLHAAFAYFDTSFYGLTDQEMASIAPKFWSADPTSKRIIFMLIRDHMSHHRGMAILYLRENGIKPPRYRGW